MNPQDKQITDKVSLSGSSKEMQFADRKAIKQIKDQTPVKPKVASTSTKPEAMNNNAAGTKRNVPNNTNRM